MKEYEVHQRLLNMGRQAHNTIPKHDLPHRKEMILSKIEKREKNNYKRTGIFTVKRVKIALACLIILLVPASVYKIIFSSVQNPEPIYEAAIDVPGAKTPALLNFFPLSKSTETENLLAVVWKSNIEGDYTPIYNSVFATSNEPHDLTTVDFQDHTDRITLISTGHSKKKYLHYRAVSIENNEPVIYMEENYVSNGQLETNKGWIKETRATNSAPFITYVIFYNINDQGSLTFSTNYIQIHKGEHLILAGNNADNDEFVHSSNILTTESASDFEFNYPGIIYVANRVGTDYLTPENHSMSFLPLNVEVIE